MTEQELKILNTSIHQVGHFITAAHQNANAHLLKHTYKLLAEGPSPGGVPTPTSLSDVLDNVVSAPGTTTIATVPNNPDMMMLQLLSQVQTLDSYISLLTAFCIYNEHPAKYDISSPSEACALIRSTAKWRNYIITGGIVKAIAGYLPVSKINNQTFSKEMTSIDLHLEFLGELFKDFNFSKITYKEIDSILTKVVQQIANLKLSFENSTATLDHFFTYYYFTTVVGTGGENQPPAMSIAKVRTFFMHIDQSSWMASVGKSSVQHIKFSMNYYDMDTQMNSGLVAADMEAINSAIKNLTGKSSDEVKKLMNIQAVQGEPIN